MTWIGMLRRRLRLLAKRSDVEREMNDEIRFHLEMEAEELARYHRLAPDDARRRAVRDFGGIERYKEDARDARGGRWLDDARQDFRYALRVLRRTRGFTAVAMLTLALAVGANTAIFSVVRGVLLRPLPYADPDRVMQLASEMRGARTAVSGPDFIDWRAQTRSFSGMSAYFLSTSNFTGQGDPERLTQARVSANLFDVLGVRPTLGRGFREGEDLPSAPRVAVLSDGLWRRRFGADSAIIGRLLTLDGFPTAVVGVAPPGIHFPVDVDFWLTTRFSDRDLAPSSRGARWLDVVARLAPGATLAGARAEMTALAARLAAQDPQHNTDVDARVVPLHEELVGSVRTPLLILLGAVGFVLLIACVNVASLSLGRTSARGTELAVRAALGADRTRIARQLLTESLVVSLGGGMAGLLLAVVGARGLVALAPPDLPRLDAVRLDGAVLLFALGITVASGLLFGLVPALHGSVFALHDRLRAGGRGGAPTVAHGRVRRTLVISEVALAIMLLAGAGLLLRSFARLREVDPGFRPAGVSTFTVSLSPVRYPDETREREFVIRLLERIRGLPGMQSAAVSFSLPLSSNSFGFTFEIRGRPSVSGPDEPRAQVRVATPDYFRTMGIPLLRGRGFTDEDRLSSKPVVVVSAETARRYWPNEDPIGQSITTGWGRGSRRFGGEIVGVVGDVRQFSLSQRPTPHVYGPFDQRPLDELTIVMRSSSPEATVLAAARRVVRDLDADLPLYDVRPLEALVAESVAQRRFYALLLAAFATVALVLAAVGIYGVIAYSVQQRSREFGIRLALGASPDRVVSMVMRQGLALVAFGTMAGLAGAAAVTRVLRGLLFDVSVTDPATFAAVPVVLGVVAILACALPARRAIAVDPATAIRADG